MTVSTTLRAEAMPRLTQVGRALTNATSLDETLRLTVECAADLLGTQPILLLLRNDDGVLEIRASYAFDKATHSFAEPMDELLIDRLQDVFGPDASQRFVGVPLVVGGEITGLLAATRTPQTEPQHAEWLLSALADQASIALETARQIEARQRLEVKLEKVEAVASSREQALRVLSHDLRAPLTTIVSYTELLESGMLGSVTDRQKAACARMRESGEHLIGLLQNVLEMTRLTAGAIQLEPRRFDVVSVLTEAVDIAVAPRAPEHLFEVTSQGPVMVFADPVRVRQVIIQLIDNAVKYTPAGTHVRLSTDADGHTALVRIEDDGPGIPPDSLARIFEPFQRGGQTVASAPAGAGLGLAIAQRLIQQMGGVISVESTRGAGTSFSIRLPQVG